MKSIFLLEKYLIKIFNSNLYYKAWLYANEHENKQLEFVITNESFYYGIMYRIKGTKDDFIKLNKKFSYKMDAEEFIEDNQTLHDILMFDYMDNNYVRKDEENEKMKKLNILKYE